MSITRVASTASMSYTAHFEHISDALRSRWEAFRTLEDEQRAFVPKPLADFADEAVAMRAEIRRLNPQKSAESIDEFVEKQIELAVSP